MHQNVHSRLFYNDLIDHNLNMSYGLNHLVNYLTCMEWNIIRKNKVHYIVTYKILMVNVVFVIIFLNTQGSC